MAESNNFSIASVEDQNLNMEIRNSDYFNNDISIWTVETEDIYIFIFLIWDDFIFFWIQSRPNCYLLFTMGFTYTIRDFDLWVTIVCSKNFQQNPKLVTIHLPPALAHLNSLDTQSYNSIYGFDEDFNLGSTIIRNWRCQPCLQRKNEFLVCGS